MPNNVESQHQIELFKRIRALRDEPGFEDLNAVWATPNGGHRADSTAGTMSREGVEPGVWDITVAVPITDIDKCCCGEFHKPIIRSTGLLIELKAPGRENQANGRGETRVVHGGLSDYQLCFATTMAERGWRLEVCYNWQIAWFVITTYLGLRAKIDADLRLRNIELVG